MTDARMLKMMITGGCGFIGANLVRQIVERDRGEELAVLDNETMCAPESLPKVPLAYHKADVCDQAALTRAFAGCDAVIHLAANTRVIESIADPRLNFEVNARGTFNTLLAARDAGVKRVVLASTGGAILGDVSPPVHEGVVPQPMSPYGASKLAAEGYGHAFAGSYGMRVTMLRFSNVYGPLSYHKTSAVAHFFKQILNRQPITIYGDGSQTRDFVYVDDLCRGILQAIDADVAGVFQLGSGNPTSLSELLGAMQDIVGKDRWPKIHYVPWRTGEVRRVWCDISKSSRVFGFRPDTPLTEGLKTTWQWFLSQASQQASAGERSEAWHLEEGPVELR
jgi:UDP-glucose 4-epimerase